MVIEKAPTFSTTFDKVLKEISDFTVASSDGGPVVRRKLSHI